MTQGYKIGVGYNVTIGSLVDIATISVSGQKFADPKVTPLFDDGEVVDRLDSLLDAEGFQTETWQFGILFQFQYTYLSLTYCGGGLSGKVTILTNLGTTSTFYRKNAIMRLKKRSELSGFPWFKNAPVTFIIKGDAS